MSFFLGAIAGVVLTFVCAYIVENSYDD